METIFQVEQEFQEATSHDAIAAVTVLCFFVSTVWHLQYLVYQIQCNYSKG